MVRSILSNIPPRCNLIEMFPYGQDAKFPPKPQLEVPHVQELDGIHTNLESPTEEDKRTLSRVADKIPSTVYRRFLIARTVALIRPVRL